MKEKKIRRIIVSAILLITAVALIVRFNVHKPEKVNTDTNVVSEIKTDTKDHGEEAEDKTEDEPEDEHEDDSINEPEDNPDDNAEDNNSGGDNGNNDNDDADAPDDNAGDTGEDPVNYITVYMTIDATLLADGEALRANNHENKIQYTGDNGIIAARVAVKVPENASVYDALHTFCLEHDIQMEASGTSFGTAYIRGINHLYEFDGGISSGWVFLVNNVYATSGASNVHLEEGDEVRWFYTLAFGKDVP